MGRCEARGMLPSAERCISVACAFSGQVDRLAHRCKTITSLYCAIRPRPFGLLPITDPAAPVFVFASFASLMVITPLPTWTATFSPERFPAVVLRLLGVELADAFGGGQIKFQRFFEANFDVGPCT
jgi:hypothetical protein